MGVFARGKRLWVRCKQPDGKWVNLRTEYFVGEETKAKRSLKAMNDRLEAGESIIAKRKEPVSVKEYAELRWFAMRRGFIASAARDEKRLELHVFKTLGKMRLEDVRPRHLADLFRAMRSGDLAPKSRHNVYGVLRALFRDAEIDGLVDKSPCILTEHQLGKNVDSNSEWRESALYTREELARLVFTAAIPLDRRVGYALQGIGGLRHGEMAGLRWRHVNTEVGPLGRLMVATSYDKGRTKTSVTRYAPIHPVLEALLADWAESGWSSMMGHAFGPDDLVLPTPLPVNRGPRVARGAMRTSSWTWKRLSADLERLGMRHRRGHDLRRTFISLARSDGAATDILRRATHQPPKEVIEGYTTFEWDVLCREVSKLKLGRPGPARLETRYTLVTISEKAMGLTEKTAVEAVGIEAPAKSSGSVDSAPDTSRSAAFPVGSREANHSNAAARSVENDGACNGVTSLRGRLIRLQQKFGGGAQ